MYHHRVIYTVSVGLEVTPIRQKSRQIKRQSFNKNDIFKIYGYLLNFSILEFCVCNTSDNGSKVLTLLELWIPIL